MITFIFVANTSHVMKLVSPNTSTDTRVLGVVIFIQNSRVKLVDVGSIWKYWVLAIEEEEYS
jgi:hypothetical protein